MDNSVFFINRIPECTAFGGFNTSSSVDAEINYHRSLFHCADHLLGNIIIWFKILQLDCTNDNIGRMPFVPDADLQLTPPINDSGKRYNSMGSFMPLLDPYVGSIEVWVSVPTKVVTADSWLMHFSSPWRENGVELPERGWSNYCAAGRPRAAPSSAARAPSPRSG